MASYLVTINYRNGRTQIVRPRSGYNGNHHQLVAAIAGRQPVKSYHQKRA
jgi:hypothetical protein